MWHIQMGVWLVLQWEQGTGQSQGMKPRDCLITNSDKSGIPEVFLLHNMQQEKQGKKILGAKDFYPLFLIKKKKKKAIRQHFGYKHLLQ